jgi:hypothetical protein
MRFLFAWKDESISCQFENFNLLSNNSDSCNYLTEVDAFAYGIPKASNVGPTPIGSWHAKVSPR